MTRLEVPCASSTRLQSILSNFTHINWKHIRPEIEWLVSEHKKLTAENAAMRAALDKAKSFIPAGMVKKIADQEIEKILQRISPSHADSDEGEA